MALRPETQLQKIREHFAKLQAKRFYGTVLVHIQGGQIIRYETTESTKLDDASYNTEKGGDQ